MQVLLSNSLFFHQKYGGVSRYSACILKEFIKKKIDYDLISPIYKNNYIKKIDDLKIHGL